MADENVSTKLIEVQRERQQSERVDRMFQALRIWRIELIAAMAQRSNEIGDMPDDVEMFALMREFRHWNLVAHSLNADPAALLVFNPVPLDAIR